MTLAPSAAPLDPVSPTAVLNTLRGAGLRISSARRLVVDALFAAEQPVSAEEIASGLGGQLTPLDPASVYRNLETLERLGLVRHLHAAHGPGRYVLARGECEYLACESCGELLEVDPRELDRARAELRTRFGYEVRFSHFPIVGRCAGCAGGAR
jgi:Fur family ferric uptake transcriptional regulator